MHHEILLALQGHCGEIVLDRQKEYVINPDLSFIGSADKAVLNQIVQLGCDFKTMQQFIAGAHEFKSNYLIGVSSGIQEIMQQYQSKLIQLENEILKQRQVVPFTHFISQLYEYFQVFPVVSHIVNQIVNKSLSGTPVLELLYQHTHTGYKRVKFWIERILYHCHKYVLV